MIQDNCADNDVLTFTCHKVGKFNFLNIKAPSELKQGKENVMFELIREISKKMRQNLTSLKIRN